MTFKEHEYVPRATNRSKSEWLGYARAAWLFARIGKYDHAWKCCCDAYTTWREVRKLHSTTERRTMMLRGLIHEEVAKRPLLTEDRQNAQDVPAGPGGSSIEGGPMPEFKREQYERVTADSTIDSRVSGVRRKGAYRASGAEIEARPSTSYALLSALRMAVGAVAVLCALAIAGALAWLAYTEGFSRTGHDESKTLPSSGAGQ